jgi:hypothetical protein
MVETFYHMEIVGSWVLGVGCIESMNTKVIPGTSISSNEAKVPFEVFKPF